MRIMVDIEVPPDFTDVEVCEIIAGTIDGATEFRVMDIAPLEDDDEA